MKASYTRTFLALLAFAFVLGLSANLAAQYPATQTNTPGHPTAQGQGQYPAPQGKAMGGAITLNAELVDKEAKARDKSVTVQVEVSGVQIVDPDVAKARGMSAATTASEPNITEQQRPTGDPTRPDPTRPDTKPQKPGQSNPATAPREEQSPSMQRGASGMTLAHFHYQLDDGPIIASTSPKMSFHGLSSGPHKIVVMLADMNHAPIGPQETLTVNIP